MASSSSIDVHDPLHIHSSDTPGLTLINEQLIGTDNYAIWSRAMLIALRAKNKLAFIDGSSKRPDAGSEKLQQWERCNAIVLSWIMNSVSKEILAGIVYATDAVEVWTDLKERFDKVNGSRIFTLHREIGKLVQGNATIAVYFSKLRQLWDEFGSLVPLPSCSCESAKKYVEYEQQHKLLQFLMGLNDSYIHVRSQVLMMSPLPTVSQAFAILSQEESHRNLLSTNISQNDTLATAFYSAQEKNKNLKCEHCNITGHTKEVCYRIVGYPPGHRLYRGPNKGVNQRAPKEWWNARNKPMGRAHASVKSTTDGDEKCNSNAAVANIFTPDQYAAILRLLTKESEAPTANMAGPLEWDDNGDW